MNTTRDNSIKKEMRLNTQYKIWYVCLAVFGWLGVILSLVTDKPIFLLVCVGGAIVPWVIMLNIDKVNLNNEIEAVKTEAKNNGEYIYYHDGKLKRTEDDKLLYVDRLTKGVYTWPENELVYTLDVDADMILNVFHFTDIKIKED